MPTENILTFEAGSLVVTNPSQTLLSLELNSLKWDERTKQWRVLAHEYRELIEALTQKNEPFQDQARQYHKCDWTPKEAITPRLHQKQALAAWSKAGYHGTVCLPTGGGKTILAIMAIAVIKRSTLIVVPTIDLMQQWYEVIGKFISAEIGLLGGGYHEIKDITVATYDSAHLHIERLGNRFAFLIFDECHHLPGEQYQQIALASLAPFRLGLSATIKRADGKEELIYKLVGPLVFEGSVHEMVGRDLAPYEVITLEVPLTEQEQAEYDSMRKCYTNFLFTNRINLSKPNGWFDFLAATSRSEKGRQAFLAYRTQKKLAQASTNKLKELWNIIESHVGARMIIFTDDNELAYRIGRFFYLPVLTHKTKVKERKQMLDLFRQGKITILVTSKVLNEGVDVPEASVGVIVSGSGAVREHVQRLGRILRAKEGKKAIMYELIAKGTGEYHVNKRRREHDAYQGTAPLYS